MAKASRYNNLLESFHQKIVKALDVDSLLPILYAKRLLLTSERDQLKTNIETNKDKAEFVYSILSQQGPYYFNQFIGALREDYQERHRELANILALEQNEINCDGLGVSTDQGLLTPRVCTRLMDFKTLSGILPLDQELGRGAYGKVFAVKYKGVVCAAKEIHSTFYNTESEEKEQKFQKKFLKECSLNQLIIHPNIVRCFGIYYPTRDSFPVMVMELMDQSLTTYLRNQNTINLSKSIAILHDIGVGLSFLHSRNPPIIHGDLSSANIILKCTEDGMLPVAKIANLGMAEVMGSYRDNAKDRLSRFFVTAFIPPEKLTNNHHQNSASTDVFSIGCVALHVFSHKWPIRVTPSSNFVDVTEVECHQKYLDMIVGVATPLKPVIKACLRDNPESRPSAAILVNNIDQVMTSHAVSKSIDEMRERNIDAMLCEAEALVNLLDSDRKRLKLSNDDSTPLLPDASSAASHLKQTEQVNVSESTTQEVIPSFEVGQNSKCHIKWAACSSLPAPLYDACVVVSDNTVYCSGFSSIDDNQHKVFCYDVNTDHWSVLPSSGHSLGVIHMVNNKLVIFGGKDSSTGRISNKVSTYSSNSNMWTAYYPDMLNARLKPGVITCSNHVIVMGGMSGESTLHDSVEVMNYRSHMQWKIVPFYLPVRMWNIKPTICGSYITVVGYTHANGCTNECYWTPIHGVISSFTKVDFTSTTSTKWHKFLSLPNGCSAMVPYSNPPIIIGGINNKKSITSDVAVFNKYKNSWRIVDSLTTARKHIGLGLLNQSNVIVVGGVVKINDAEEATTDVEIGSFVPY